MVCVLVSEDTSGHFLVGSVYNLSIYEVVCYCGLNSSLIFCLVQNFSAKLHDKLEMAAYNFWTRFCRS